MSISCLIFEYIIMFINGSIIIRIKSNSQAVKLILHPHRGQLNPFRSLEINSLVFVLSSSYALREQVPSKKEHTFDQWNSRRIHKLACKIYYIHNPKGLAQVLKVFNLVSISLRTKIQIPLMQTIS
jgi:hypothetical protein